MDYEEEQKNEIEALQEIYYNEIEVLSDKPPFSLIIKVKSQSSNFDESYGRSESDETNDDRDDEDDYGDSGDEVETLDVSQLRKSPPMSVTLRFDLPSKYPDAKPSIEILNSKNLDDYDLKELLSTVQNRAEQSLGNVMIFTLINEATEWLIMMTSRIEDEIQMEKERKAKADEEEQVKRLEGTKVTISSFLAWKAKFDAEMLKAKMEKNLNTPTTGGGGQRRLTGREMFETDKSLIESDLNFDDLDQNQIESLLQIDDDGDEFDPAQFSDSSDKDEDYPLSDDDGSCDDNNGDHLFTSDSKEASIEKK